jgi:replicative DNA helicase Mcm
MEQYTESHVVTKLIDIFNHRKYSDIISRLRPESTFTLNVMEDNLYEYFTDSKEEFKELVKEAIFSMKNEQYGTKVDVRYDFRNIKINLVSDHVIKMHNLNARDHERNIVTFDCEIIAVEREKSYVKQATGICPQCFKEMDIKSDYDRDITKTICPNMACKNQKVNLDTKNLVTSNIQYVYFQELLSDARNNSPIIMRAVTTDELSGTLFVGQKKRISGMYKSVIGKDKNKDNINEITIEVFSAKDLEKKNDVCLTSEEIQELVKESKRDGFMDDVVGSFAPLIIGYKDIKFSILLMLAGGYSKVKRGDINVLLVGDPSLAKSELLKECSKVSSKSMYTSGRGASAAGLTIGLVKMDNGSMVAQAGVLPLCNEGHACIDEFDKMNPIDRSAMHEGMEQQTVSIAKAGFRMTLPAKTSILAAANPKYGKYDTEMSLIDNIDIPVPLVSRFDLIWLIRDKVDKSQDIIKAEHVLETFTGEDMTNKVFLDRNKLTSYINFVKEIKPTISDEAKAKLSEIYQKMRSLSAGNDSLAVGVRQLEALARLSTAHAKMMFKNEVDETDVMVVEGLLKSMYESLGVKMDSGFTQATLVMGKKETKEQTATRVWKECENEGKSVKYSDFIKKLSETGLYDESSAKSLFAQWEMKCMIKLNGDGRYQKI